MPGRIHRLSDTPELSPRGGIPKEWGESFAEVGSNGMPAVKYVFEDVWRVTAQDCTLNPAVEVPDPGDGFLRIEATAETFDFTPEGQLLPWRRFYGVDSNGRVFEEAASETAALMCRFVNESGETPSKAPNAKYATTVIVALPEGAETVRFSHQRVTDDSKDIRTVWREKRTWGPAW